MYRLKAAYSKRISTFMITIILLISGITILSDEEGGQAKESDSPTRRGEMGNWSKLPTEDWPPTIDPQNCEIMYREADDELVVFNRENNQEWEVWSFFGNNETWYKWNTSGDKPDARYSLRGFISDPEDDMGYFFGGYRRSGWSTYTLDQLHIFHYSNMTWVEIDSPQTIDGVYSCEMVYDRSSDSVWIFGGRDSDGDFHNEIIQFNLTDGWNIPSPTLKPGGRDQPSMCITPDGNSIYMALGRDYQQGWTSRYTNDLWVFFVHNTTWMEIIDEIGIETDAGSLMVYRDDTDDILLSMGFDGDMDLTDTYVIDPSDGSFIQMGMAGGIMGRTIGAWDLSNDLGEVYILGDTDNNKDAWSLDPYALTTQMIPPSLPWSGGAAFTGYDPDDGGKLMTLQMGAQGSTSLVHYSLTEEKWIREYVDTIGGPDYHSYMSGCYDPVDDTFYVYGGHESYRVSQNTYHYYFYDEFWRLWTENGTWERINLHAPPGKLSRASMCVDWESEYRHVYIYGGQTHGGESEAIARYNITGNIWDVMNPPIKPEGRRNSALKYDPYNDGLWMFGGRDNQSSVTTYNDLWFFHINKKKWEDRSYGLGKPSTRYGHSLAVNHHNGEVIVFGGDDESDETLHTWRVGWRDWVNVQSTYNPGRDWQYHSMHYSPETGLFYLWAGSGYGVEVWSYNPILRTVLTNARLNPPQGKEVEGAFPTVGTYTLEIKGYTDLPESDITALNVSFKTTGDESGFIWYASNDTVARYGNVSWYEVGPGDVEIVEGSLKVEFPITFSFEMPDQQTVDIHYVPICSQAWTEPRRTVDAFTMNSELDIKGYQFYTERQSDIVEDGWLFGRSNLTADNLEVYFLADSRVQPANSTFKITLENQLGEGDQWIFRSGEKGNLTVPVKGEDGEFSYYWLNLSTIDGEVIRSNRFRFRIDTDPPGIVRDVKIRADRVDDDIWGFDDDADEAYITWGDVYENGSGLQGICYSVDVNTWPAKSNMTNEFPSIQIKGGEGVHTVYVWAVDNTDRAGPVTEAKMIIDDHRVVFEDPRPAVPINVTDPAYTVRIKLRDELTGVDLNSIQYRVSDESRQFGDWTDFPHDFTDPGAVLNISYRMDLVPGVKNMVQFRAKDIAAEARNEDYRKWRSSVVFAITYKPGLDDPIIELSSPADGTETDEDITLAWSGEYVNPLNLTYQVVITDPRGEVRTLEAHDSASMVFSPDIPGEYSWSVRGLADGKRNMSQVRTFFYDPPFADITPPEKLEVTQGERFTANFSITNNLKVSVNLTAALEEGSGMELIDSAMPSAGPGETVTASLTIRSGDLEPDVHSLTVLFTDDFDRSGSFEFEVDVLKKDEKREDDEEEEDEEGMGLFIIIGAAVLLLIILAVVVFLFMRRDDEDEEEVVEEETEDEEYDPTGKIAEGQTVDIESPQGPGMPGMEEDIRSMGSNVVEADYIPSPEE